MSKTDQNLYITNTGTLPCVPFLDIKNKILGKKYELSIAFVTPKVAKKLNIEHRSKDYIPNTLSFSLSENSGEIILCKSALRREYKNFDMDYDKYVTFILIHSCLHLKGFEHGSTMEEAEKKLLNFFTKKINEKTHNSRH